MLNAVPAVSNNPVNPNPEMAGMFGLERIQRNPVSARLGKGLKIAKVRDGMSKTVMLSEVLSWNAVNETGGSVDPTVPQGNDDWRGVWMIPSVGASAFTGKAPPNSPEADVIPACGTGLMETPLARRMPCREERQSPNIFASARSAHPGGVNAANGDISVAFVSDDIDQLVWQAKCTRGGKEVVGDR
jgi:hypothetical protein